MTRDEEFNDIPELGPARDALDQTDIPTLKPAATAKLQRNAMPETVTAADKSGGGLMAWVLLLLMIVVGGGGYWGMTHFNQLQKELILANQRLTDLEGLINATDESANKSGAALQAQIQKFLQEESKRGKHVDSELAKLWTVAYQRNKPKIAEIDNSLAALDKQSGQLVKQSAQLAEQVKLALGGLDQAGIDLTALTQSLQSQQQTLVELGAQVTLLDQASQELDALQDTQLSGLEQQLAALKQNPPVPQALADTIKEQQQAIAAINSFRQQANTELLRLAGRIDQLQRTAKVVATPVAPASPSTTPAQ